MISSPVTSAVEDDLKEIPEQRLPRQQRLQKNIQYFWSRWADYFHGLQLGLKEIKEIGLGMLYYST